MAGSAALLIALAIGGTPSLLAQGALGELRVRVSDPSGAPVRTTVVVSNDAARASEEVATDPRGAAVVRDLPLGRYHVTIRVPGFAPYDAVVELRSVIPVDYPVRLNLAGVDAAVTVRAEASDTLLDPTGPGTPNYIGLDLLRDPPAAAPGRGLIELVNAQPGWLLEANGTLHPRGSEYQVQYVVDGVPLRDNRSPAFSRAMDADEYEAVSVRTAGYPAEYGGKLGGVIDVTTRRESREGWHGATSLTSGSFAQLAGRASVRFVKGTTGVGVGAELLRTDRYLDPPTEANWTNHARGGGLSAHVDRTWGSGDRTRGYVEHQQTTFLVPNETFQEALGQRQVRRSDETRLQLSHQHMLSSRMMLEAAFMARRAHATLEANERSSPIRPAQDRGFRQMYGNGSISGTFGRHTIKTGVEIGSTRLDERFSAEITDYAVGDVEVFDPDVPAEFSFAERGTERDRAAYIQDTIRAGRLSASAGLRYDWTHLRRTEQAWSPRLTVSWYTPSAGLLVRASYDRVFQTPETENLLLSSGDLSSRLGGGAHSLALLSSRGNFYEAGVSRLFFGRFRLDANYFVREADNFADDDLLLNTAIAFPIAFASGKVEGMELKGDLPAWRNWSASFAYSLSRGVGRLPIAGGLFLGSGVDGLLASTDEFPLTQDQRHSLRGRVQYRLSPRTWLAAAARYDSGLPVELEGEIELEPLESQYGKRIVDRVNFTTGRVRPSFAIDASCGVVLWSKGDRALRARVDVTNAASRLNVINFAGLLSGTAVSAPRSWTARLDWQF